LEHIAFEFFTVSTTEGHPNSRAVNTPLTNFNMHLAQIWFDGFASIHIKTFDSLHDTHAGRSLRTDPLDSDSKFRQQRFDGKSKAVQAIAVVTLSNLTVSAERRAAAAATLDTVNGLVT
jgi:hypothetical protein